MAEERAYKREQLLIATEAKLEEIKRASNRSRAPYRRKDKIARRVERQCAKYKMLKHFELTITENSVEYTRNEQSIADEAAWDGFYVVRAGNVGADEMTTNKIVETYTPRHQNFLFIKYQYLLNFLNKLYVSSYGLRDRSKRPGRYR